MKPFVVLIATFLISLTAIIFFQNKYDIAFSARIAMSAMLIFTSIAHFVFTKGMTMMIPDFVPFKIWVVYLTGILEILAAIAFQIPDYTTMAGWFVIIFFILILPANINAAIRHVDYQKGNLEGSGTNYLWFRVPLQILFILWTYFSAIQF